MPDQHKIYQIIKQIRKTPLVLHGIILQILRSWFGVNSDQFKYISDDPLANRLVIDPSYNWDPENCQNRPGIYVKRLVYVPKGWARAGTDDLLKIGIEAANQYTILPVCSFLIYCISKLPGEVEKLSWEAGELLIALAPIIKRDFGFTSFDVDQIGEIGKVEEYKEFWTIPISLSIKFAESWEIQQVVPKLKQVLVNAYTTVADQLDSSYGEGGYSDGEYK